VLLRGLVDDAAVFPPGNAPLREAVAGHGQHRAAWYADLVGPLLLPAVDLAGVEATETPVEVGLIGERPALAKALEVVPAGVRVRHVESPVAKRGEDPMPGLEAFVAMLGDRLTGYAEVPLTWGLVSALDHVAEARAAGVTVAPKFRTGGLAAELFPTPVELAAVICACRDRGLPFKLTAGLHHAIRHTDPETGLVHHGFLNILAAVLAAADGGEPMDLAEVLGTVDPVLLLNGPRSALRQERPLWIGFGSCSMSEPVDDLLALGLLRGPA
jgi:hypothetical protein